MESNKTRTEADRVEEEELGIYEDKGSGTDLSDSETIKHGLDENNNEVNDEDTRSLTPVVTNQNNNQSSIESNEQLEKEPIDAQSQEDRGDNAPKTDTAKRRAVTISEPAATEVKQSAKSRQFSADPALEIKGILKTPCSTPASGHRVTRAESSIPDVNVDPPPPSSQSSRPVDRELLSAARDIEYIQKKCLGNNTRRNGLNYNLRDSPLIASAIGRGNTSSQNVFLHQNRPSPMIPLKAWRGYSGNIYFDPIKINRVSSAYGAIETVSGSQQTSRATTQEARKRRQKTAKPDLNTIPVHCDIPPRPAIIMDKGSVMSKENREIQDDLEWIRNSEHVGSLKIESGAGDRARSKQSAGNQSGKQAERRNVNLCKGSVAHRLAKQRRIAQNAERPGSKFSVSGDRYRSPMYMNPLLRTSTQYSQSANRPVTNSLDISHGHYTSMDKLPPLEQLRASLKKTETGSASNKQQASRRVSIVSEDKVPSYVRLTRTIPPTVS